MIESTDMAKKTKISILECNSLFRMMLSAMINSINGYELDSVYEDLASAQTQLVSPSDILIVDLE